MILSKTAIQRPVTTWVMIVALAITGYLAYTGMSVNFMPDTSVPIITIQVVYPGAGAEEIETTITKLIEDEVSTLSGLDYINSYIMEGATQVVCWFEMDKDEDVASQELKDKVDAIVADFPDDAEPPVIEKIQVGAEGVVTLAFVSTMSPSEAYEYVDKQIKDRLARINGVAQVEVTGGQEREIHVVLNSTNLKKFDLSPLQVVGFLRQNNMSLPGGTIRKDGVEYSVKFDGEFETMAEIQNVMIVTPRGERRLGEIARIIDTEERLQKIGRYYEFPTRDLAGRNTAAPGNRTVINLAVVKQSTANEVRVAEAAIAEVLKIRNDLPPGASLEIASDESVFTRESVDDTMSAIYLGVLFTAIVLYLFLHSFSMTFVVGMSMPVVLISTFLLMNGSNFSLNLMSLMALSVSVGTLVTNSVVILENIDRYMSMGMNKVDASDKGTAEIAVAVLASTLTNVVVFVPIATMESIIGQFFKEFGMTVVYIMIFSILVSFTVTPMLSSQILSDRKRQQGPFTRRFEAMFERFSQWYTHVLEWLLSGWVKRIGLGLLSVFLLIGTLLFVGPRLGSEFVPFSDDGRLRVSVEMPPEYEVRRTSAVFQEIESRLKQHAIIEKIIVNIGDLGNSSGPNMGRIDVRLHKERPISTQDLATQLSYELADIPDALIKVSTISRVGRGNAPIQMEIMGTELAKVREITRQVFEIVQQTPGAINVDTDIRAGRPEIQIIPRREMLAEFNTTGYDIAMTIRANIEGLIASQYRVAGEEYDLRVKLEDADVDDIEKIKSVVVLTPKGNKKISELADLRYSTAPTMIYRKNKLKIHLVTADVGSRTLGEIVADIQEKVDAAIELPPQYKVQAGGDAEIQADANTDLGNAFMLAFVLTFLLIVAILESWLQGILIMFTIPLAMIGVFWSLFISGESMNIFSMMAMVMLIGIVVNNAILVLDYANQLRNVGHNKMQAILEACPTKLKAVVMATLASMLGMLPLALGLGSGAELRQGMGIVSIGGLAVSSLLTLFVIPALYVQFVRDKKK